MLIDKIYLTETDPSLWVSDNIEHLNTYFEQHLEPDEIHPAVLYSYYVDYYLSQVQNGGIAQFAYNTQWRSGTLHYVEFGLAEMGATEHLNLLEEIADVILQDIGIDNFIEFTREDFFAETAHQQVIKDKLNALNDKFFAINARENLATLNQHFLHHHPDTVVVSFAEFQTTLQQLKQHPTLQARQHEHLSQLPSHLRRIHQLCEECGCELLHVMEKENDDEPWHFFTSRGRFFMVEQGDKVVMMTYRNPEIVASINK